MFSLWPSSAWAYVCLHPLEQAALFSGRSKKQSLSGRIKGTEKRLEKLADNHEKLEDKISDWTDDLANTLKEDGITLEDGVSGAAEAVSVYMEAKQDQWDTEGVPWYNPDKPRLSKKYFKRNGAVNERAFCKDYASNKRDCEKSIKQLEKYHKKLSVIQELGEQGEELLENLQEEQFNREIGLSDAEETEADGLCFECLDELRELDKPTTGQVVGNALSVLAGGALSYFGYRAGQRETRSLNDLRLRQGYEPMSALGPSWAGASMGLPFISHGIHGLAGGNSRFGSFACSPGFANGANMYSPFGHYGMGMGGMPGMGMYGGMPGMGAYGGLQLGMPGMGMYGGMPGMMPGMGMGGMPGMMPGMGAYGGLQFGMPGMGMYGGMPGMGAYGGLQFGMPGMGMYGGGMPGMMPGMGMGGMPGMGAYGGLQFGMPGMGMYGGGMPGMMPGMGMGGMPGMMPGMGAYGGLQFGMPGMGMYGGMPGMMPGMNPQAQYQQQQYAQYQQFQQQQMQARVQMQQAWLQHQQSIQQDWMQRKQVIGSLTQEIHKIQQQIQLVASGGVGSSVLGVTTASLNTGANLGIQLASAGGAPVHSPTPSIHINTNPGGDLPVIESR